MALGGIPKPMSLQRRDSGYDTWNTPRIAQAFVKMAESGRAKVKELLSRHSELEQSETKAQAALITVLSLTQITELKLLLDIGRQGHRFYDFVLAMLVACISLEIFVGIIIIYIGNLHYHGISNGHGMCTYISNCLACCGAGQQMYRTPGGGAKRSSYMGGREPLHMSTRSSGVHVTGGGSGAMIQDDVEVVGCCGLPPESSLESLVDLERADCTIEFTRIKLADANVKISRAANYVKVVEEAVKKTPGNSEMDEELVRAREDLSSAVLEKEEADAEQKLAEAQQHHAFFLKEQYEDRQERYTFRKVSFWQHMATYLLYFVMLLNVFITTFGISSGHSSDIFGSGASIGVVPVPHPAYHNQTHTGYQ